MGMKKKRGCFERWANKCRVNRGVRENGGFGESAEHGPTRGGEGGGTSGGAADIGDEGRVL